MILEPALAVARADASAKAFFQSFSADCPLIFLALLAAEDHRGPQHRGIDYFSLGRALMKWPLIGKLYGVSTIEQQLVRTIFPRNGALLPNKLAELLSSTYMAHCLRKQTIWASYLQLAYYGEDLRGYGAVRTIFERHDQPLSIAAAASIVACLKYPKPHPSTETWARLHERRRGYVIGRLSLARTLHPQVGYLTSQTV